MDNKPKEESCWTLLRSTCIVIYVNYQASDHLDLPVHEILYSGYPTMLIDLSQKMVRESPAYSRHVTHAQDQWYNELIGLQYGMTEPCIPEG